MRRGVAVVLIAAFMSGMIAQASEIIYTEEDKSNYVIEPIFESNGWKCPPKTKIIAKYCWDGVYGSFLRCGYVCHPVKKIIGGMDPIP